MSSGRRWAGGLAIVAAFIWSAWSTEVSLGRLVEGVPFMIDFVRRMLPPDLRVLGQALTGALQTLQIAIAGTAVGALLALPVAFAAARNTAPRWVFYWTRSALNAFRAIDTLVYALFFVAAVGLGPFPGVLAVVVYTATVLAKLYSEAIEAIDPRPVEGIRATGARRIPEIMFGVLPQVVPLWSSFILYRLETNVRSATTLGIVGAGGIGQTLYESIRSFHYAETAAQMIVVIVTVVAIDLVSARLRKALV